MEDWSRAEVALARYRDMPSFLGIQEECLAIMAGESVHVQHATKLYERMAGLRASLQSRLEDPATEAAELQEAVELLRLLGVGSHELCTAFLQHAAAQVKGNLNQSFSRALC